MNDVVVTAVLTRTPEPDRMAAEHDETVEVTGIYCTVLYVLRNCFANQEISLSLAQIAPHRASSSSAVGAKWLQPEPQVRLEQIGNSSRFLDDFGRLASAPRTSLRPDRQATDHRSDV
jgi:hypothetical protein